MPVDVHLVLRRDGEGGPEAQLSRRAGPVYAAGMRLLPSRHLDPGGDLVEAVIREAHEETGILIAAEDVTAAVAVHHHPPIPAAPHQLGRAPDQPSRPTACGSARRWAVDGLPIQRSPSRSRAAEAWLGPHAETASVREAIHATVMDLGPPS
ncbi:NUDIX domain-containing protein [Streptomyces sp. NPDC056224]|uniref:NUDIX domain-containing protein n=1 Tax=Streptomyces sp. NPDC056224 TaxID=3345750 RepID=UPI0035E26477